MRGVQEKMRRLLLATSLNCILIFNVARPGTPKRKRKPCLANDGNAEVKEIHLQIFQNKSPAKKAFHALMEIHIHLASDLSHEASDLADSTCSSLISRSTLFPVLAALYCIAMETPRRVIRLLMTSTHMNM